MNKKKLMENLALLKEQYCSTRQATKEICNNLTSEDLQVQSMPDASPLKWHLAHTTWAFETFILKAKNKNYQVFDKSFEYLFNSYYNAIGAQFSRSQRGLLTRPSIKEINLYRQYVDEAMIDFLDHKMNLLSESDASKLVQLILLMINHEQQHQELMLTDLKHLLFINPTYPDYGRQEILDNTLNKNSISFSGDLYTIGHENESFYFDNEGPPHAYYVNDFKLDTHLVSNAEYLEFIESNGYHTASYWLSEAWQKINQNQVTHPHYWVKQDNQWFEFTLNGLIPLSPHSPVKHVNYFEANAYASWQNKRLPTEQEWEVAARSQNPQLKQIFGQLWQWTSSSYSAYPGFKPATGAIGEYNGKFMVNQYVLKGGSIVTPCGHIRPSYRNFFYPDASWQYSGIRLAETI
ncbi:ergothioneine biosynthesis protein EgtB [Aliikangiella sp. IMCC44359]|uniref:ergothioneine biosynthesis protein EgtB n=1 Tax=Aliikangiella sp. IMCC44359 TaxID=3459125 RepID=UPI00403AD9FF